MGNEKYLNYYVEILTGTMTDAVIRNVSLQANARVTDEALKDQVNRNEDLTQQVNNLNDQIKKLKLANEQSENERIAELEDKNKGHLNRIGDLEIQLNDLNNMRDEYDNVKNQVSHLESFRNELVKVREENKTLQETNNNTISKMQIDHDNMVKKLVEEHELIVKTLNKKIDYLQLTPAKRKKVDAEKALVVEQIKADLNVTPKAKIFKVEPPNMVVKDGGSF
jgi:DNA repair exonuclease SbcCD ATPase subunit